MDNKINRFIAVDEATEVDCRPCFEHCAPQYRSTGNPKEDVQEVTETGFRNHRSPHSSAQVGVDSVTKDARDSSDGPKSGCCNEKSGSRSSCC